MSIVLSREDQNYRRLAQASWGLTNEQMRGMHVHHHPPASEGGRNIPEHLYVCSPSMHAFGWHSESYFTLKASTSSGNKHGPRGRPPKKTAPTERDKQVYELRKQGLSGTKIAEQLGLTRQMAKDGYSECVRFGYPKLPNPRTGPPKGTPGKPCSESTKLTLKLLVVGKKWWVNKNGEVLHQRENPGPGWQQGRKWKNPLPS